MFEGMYCVCFVNRKISGKLLTIRFQKKISVMVITMRSSVLVFTSRITYHTMLKGI